MKNSPDSPATSSCPRQETLWSVWCKIDKGLFAGQDLTDDFPGDGTETEAKMTMAVGEDDVRQAWRASDDRERIGRAGTVAHPQRVRACFGAGEDRRGMIEETLRKGLRGGLVRPRQFRDAGHPHSSIHGSEHDLPVLGFDRER